MSILRFCLVCFVGTSILAMSACSPVNIDDDSTQAKLQRNEEKLKAVYASVTGTYKGLISIPGRANGLSASFVFYTVKINDGVDANNAPKSYTELRAQLRFDQVGEYDDHVFKVDFKEHTGEVYLTQLAETSQMPGAVKEAICPVGPKDSALQARGAIIGGQLRGDLISAGKVGTFRMERKSTQADIPVRDQAQRLLRAFQKVSGSYDGVVGSADAPLAARVVLRIEQVSSGPGLKCPELMGYFRYTKAVGELNDSSFKVTYRESTGEILFNYSGNAAAGACAVGPNDAELKIDGLLESVKLSGAMTGATGDFGAIALRKVSDRTEIANDQIERLKQVYEPLVGTYGGRFTGSGQNGFPVKVTVNLVMNPISPFVSCPVLNAQYSRPDMVVDPSIGMLLLRADYYPRNDRLVLKTDMQAPSSGHPGHKDLNIDAKLTALGFTGQMTWWNRTGSVQVKRCRGTMVTPQGECRD